MKKTGLISAAIMLCFACNSNNAGKATDHNNINDSFAGKATPTPGLGSDPTRNDPSRPGPAEQQKAFDSSARIKNAKPTPGVGNDPTRNNASKNPSPSN